MKRMDRKVYIKSMAQISRLQPDPDCGSLFSVMEARRMSRLMKRAVAVSHDALAQAGLSVPDAVIAGTGLGCIENTEQFIRSLTGLSDTPLRPTHFMQSTHNTIASLIAIRLKCHGYNATYSHLGISFESALLDAFLRLKSGRARNALVGAFEEMTPDFARILNKGGYAVPTEDPLSETAVAMVLDTDPEAALCELTEVRLGFPAVTDPSCPAETDPSCPAVTGHLARPDYVARYGDNFSVSALGACDAVGLIAAGTYPAVCLENNFYGKSFATVLFKSVCGR